MSWKSKANKEHHKYPYLLNEFKNNKGQVEITAPNQVWSSDITYIRLENGYAYLAAIIDWHTKKILSWKLSNTMDVNLTTSVLKTALDYKTPDEVYYKSANDKSYNAKKVLLGVA